MGKKKRGKKQTDEDIRQQRLLREAQRQQFKNPPPVKRQHRGQR